MILKAQQTGTQVSVQMVYYPQFDMRPPPEPFFSWAGGRERSRVPVVCFLGLHTVAPHELSNTCMYEIRQWHTSVWNQICENSCPDDFGTSAPRRTDNKISSHFYTLQLRIINPILIGNFWDKSSTDTDYRLTQGVDWEHLKKITVYYFARGRAHCCWMTGALLV